VIQLAKNYRAYSSISLVKLTVPPRTRSRTTHHLGATPIDGSCPPSSNTHRPDRFLPRSAPKVSWHLQGVYQSPPSGRHQQSVDFELAVAG
jgi:hypothetical protein